MPGLIKDLMEGTRVWAGIETCLNMREKQFAAKELFSKYQNIERLLMIFDGSFIPLKKYCFWNRILSLMMS